MEFYIGCVTASSNAGSLFRNLVADDPDPCVVNNDDLDGASDLLFQLPQAEVKK